MTCITPKGTVRFKYRCSHILRETRWLVGPHFSQVQSRAAFRGSFWETGESSAAGFAAPDLAFSELGQQSPLGHMEGRPLSPSFALLTVKCLRVRQVPKVDRQLSVSRKLRGLQMTF
jgi:hypothetical protein